MDIEITITKIIANITITEDRKDNILAFGSIWFFQAEQTEPIFKVKGFTLRKHENKETGAGFIKATSPAYRAGQHFITSFIIHDKELFFKFNKLLLDEFHKQTGSSLEPKESEKPEDEVNPDEIPF